MSEYLTPQESFWAGDFGDDYRRRNVSEQLLAANLALFADVFRGQPAPVSAIELGANIGMNLRALKLIFPAAQLSAVEINAAAAKELGSVIDPTEVYHQSILNWSPTRKWDLVLVKGLLIHLNPEHLAAVYRTMAAASCKFVLICEYYNPTPIQVEYRGHKDRLFKRDWCSDFLDVAPEFALLDYGFVYRKDPAFPQDDVTWFLLRR